MSAFYTLIGLIKIFQNTDFTELGFQRVIIIITNKLLLCNNIENDVHISVTLLIQWTVARLKWIKNFTIVNINVTIVYNYYFTIMTPEAERFNGWAAMLGFVAALGAYVSTGQIIPGWF